MSKVPASFPTSAWTAVGDTWNDNYKLYYARLVAARDRANTNPESVGLSVEWYGTSCVNPTRHALDPR